MVDCWLVVFYYYYTTTNTNTNTYVLVRAVWQLETAGGGGNIFHFQAVRL
jgi:hypothetical protein